MKILILGDVHAQWNALNLTISKALKKHPDINQIWQVGDLGINWPGTKSYIPSAFLRNKDIWPIWWCDGNHEIHPELKKDHRPYLQYMDRGQIMEMRETTPQFIDIYSSLWIGGATSPDKDSRTIGIDWFPEESITYRDVEICLAKQGPIDIMICHEHPEDFPWNNKKISYFPDNIGRSDRVALQTIVDHHKPKYLFHGHWHVADHGIHESTEWVCCPVIDSLEYTVLDTDVNKVFCSWEKQ